MPARGVTVARAICRHDPRHTIDPIIVWTPGIACPVCDGPTTVYHATGGYAAGTTWHPFGCECPQCLR